MEILKIIEQLRTLDSSHWNERTATNRAVLPILNALGWPNFDIQFEENVAQGKQRLPDIMLPAEKHSVVIECKKPAVNLDDAGVVNQLIEYAFHNHPLLAVLTNGFKWDMYLPRADGAVPERRFASIDLRSQDNPNDLFSELSRFLERSTVESGDAHSNAEKRLESNRIGENIQDVLPVAWEELLTNPPASLIELVAMKVQEHVVHNPTHNQVKNFLYQRTNPAVTHISGDSETQQGSRESASQQHTITGRKPASPISAFVLWGQREEVKTWKDLTARVAANIYRRHRSDFDHRISEFPYIAKSDNNMRSPRPIPNSPYYINTHGGALGLEERCQKLLEFFGHSKNDLKIIE